MRLQTDPVTTQLQKSQGDWVYIYVTNQLCPVCTIDIDITKSLSRNCSFPA